MENTINTPTAMPMDVPMPTPSVTAKSKEHWLVEMTGGLALASTIVSGLTLFYLVIQYGMLK